MALTEQKRIQLDSIVRQMIDNKESDEDIGFVVEDFKKKYDPEVQKLVQQTEKTISIGDQKVQNPLEAFSSTLLGGLKRAGETVYDIGKFGAETLGRVPSVIVGEGFKGAEVPQKPEFLKRQGLQEKTGAAAEQVAELIGTGIGKAGSVIAEKGAETIGKIGKKIGETIYEKVIPLSSKEAGLIQTYKADNPVTKRIASFFTGEVEAPRLAAKTGVEKGLAGTESMIGIGAKRVSQDLWKNKIAPSVKAIKEKINTSELFTDVEKSISKIADPSTRKSRLQALEAIKDDYKDTPELSYTLAQQIKSELQKALPAKTWRGEDIAGSYNNVRRIIAEKIRQKTYDKLSDVNIRKDYLDYGNLLQLQELGKAAMTGQKLKGGFGTFWSGILEKTAVPIGTAGGQVIYRAGDLVFIASKGIKKLGDYLGNLSLLK